MATAKSPAMLFYLDNARSRAGALNENYARELMELHTIGVDAGYTQKDVTELARVFTGWSIDRAQTAAFRFRRVAARQRREDGPRRAPAGGGMDEGERMIRFLARHPSTAKHIATKLCTASSATSLRRRSSSASRSDSATRTAICARR